MACTKCKAAPTASNCCNTNNVAPLNPCRKHQAPNGYHYVWDSTLNKCVLVNDATGAVVDQSMPLNSFDLSNPASAVNSLKSFVQTNPLLSIAIGYGLYYVITKKK